ncbi:MAG TPA: phage holin family protein [Acidiferrobacteraceae bacterium]|nr:phage holin family protein [Acidiferrobacteraceae bacterium]
MNSASSTGLWATITALFRTAVRALLASLRVRVDLLVLDLEVERRFFMRILALGALMLLFLTLGCLLLSLWVILLFWAHRTWAAGVLGGTYLALALVVGWRLQYQVRKKPPLLSATLGELGRDQAAASR